MVYIPTQGCARSAITTFSIQVHPLMRCDHQRAGNINLHITRETSDINDKEIICIRTRVRNYIGVLRRMISYLMIRQQHVHAPLRIDIGESALAFHLNFIQRLIVWCSSVSGQAYDMRFAIVEHREAQRRLSQVYVLE